MEHPWLVLARIAIIAPVYVLAPVVAVAPAAAQDLPVYTDSLQSGFQNFSFGGGSDFANAAPTHGGVASIAFTGNATFNAVSGSCSGRGRTRSR
jgi:hypothetical protein